MKHISLAAKYRPQAFRELVGQETIRDVLSKAVLENKVAPAYLLSGTRGVGKTTIARILAKALNCENRAQRADGEPCNECDTCTRITANAYVDVVEIDGASNRGIEDAKKIREIVQYAPLEGKYRIIIIDEAHMLTKESFNALLKTLEEPPAHTRFVLATTEAQRFPITILSRCQHFVFKQVSEDELNANIKRILDAEKWQYEEEAISLLASRAAGSVRDSLSLLDQSLAFAQNPLSAKLIRNILGLAGKEVLENILNAIAQNDSLAIAKTTQEMMLQGVDITHFVKEFAQVWRSLFLISQYKEKAFELLKLSKDEEAAYLNYAKLFAPSFIHSAWQMTLEGQRRIVKSLEPSVSLELFLINLALLPQLLPIRELAPVGEVDEAQKKSPLAENSQNFQELGKPIADFEERASLAKAEDGVDFQEKGVAEKKVEVLEESRAPEESQAPEENQDLGIQLENTYEQPQRNAEDLNPLDIEAFLDFLSAKKHNALAQALKQCEKFLLQEENFLRLVLNAPSNYLAKQLNEVAFHKSLQENLEEWAGQKVRLEVHTAKAPRAKIELREELEGMEIIKEIQNLLNAHIVHCENKKVE